MTWVLVFAGIALASLVVVACYGVWLAHKASDVMSEVQVLSDRGQQLASLLAQIEVPAGPGGPPRTHSERTAATDLEAGSDGVR